MARIYGANGSMALLNVAERSYREAKKDGKPKVRKMRDTTNIQGRVGMEADKRKKSS